MSEHQWRTSLQNPKLPDWAVLQTEPVSLKMWAALVGMALTVFVALELHKLSWAKRRGVPHPLLSEREGEL